MGGKKAEIMKSIKESESEEGVVQT